MTKITHVEQRLTRPGFLKIHEVTIHQSETAPVVREVMHRGDAACILLVDPTTRKALLVKELRVGPIMRMLANPANTTSFQKGFQLGPIAGMVDKGESPIETVLRESTEEAGLDLNAQLSQRGNLIGPLSTYVSPGGTSEVVHHFVGLCPLPETLHGQIHGCASEQERTELVLVPLAHMTPEVFMASGQPVNGLLATCLSLVPRTLF